MARIKMPKITKGIYDKLRGVPWPKVEKKSKPYVPANIDLHRAVALWWDGRRVAGSQLSEGAYLRQHDYRGDEPWKDEIATQALWMDFCASDLGLPCTAGEFLHAFKLHATEIRGIRDRMAPTHDERGRIVLRPRRRFIQFRGPAK